MHRHKLVLNAEATEFSLADGTLSEEPKGVSEEEMEGRFFCCNYMDMKIQGQRLHHSDVTVLFLILLFLLILPPAFHQHIFSCVFLQLAAMQS